MDVLTILRVWGYENVEDMHQTYRAQFLRLCAALHEPMDSPGRMERIEAADAARMHARDAARAVGAGLSNYW